MSKIYEHPWYAAQLELESTTTSDAPSKLKPRPETTGPKSTDLNRKGDYWEKHVIMSAWERGAEVFPNAGCSGKTDMVLKIDDQLYSIDVKTMRWKPDSGTWRSPAGKLPDGIWLVLVNPETRDIRWANFRGTERPNCPPGLEDFWK